MDQAPKLPKSPPPPKATHPSQSIPNPDPASEFGRLVRLYRQQRKHSLTWLARATGMDTGYLSRMERGILPTLPLPETIDRLATALELSPGERRALYTAVGELTDEIYRLALRVQSHPQLYRLALILACLPTVALLRIGQRYRLKLNPKKGCS